MIDEKRNTFAPFDVLPHLRNSTVPTVFCDFDGVLNAMPFEEVWIGEGVIDTIAMITRSNWRIEARQPDPKKHFVWDRVEEGSTGGKTYTLRFSTELIEKFKELIESKRINFVWLTTWNADAVKVLNPLLGFPADTPYLPWFKAREEMGHGQGGKFRAIRDFFLESGDEGKHPFIWIDDVATDVYVDRTPEGYKVKPWYSFKEEHDVDSLILQPEHLYGINRNQWARIEKFVAKQA